MPLNNYKSLFNTLLFKQQTIEIFIRLKFNISDHINFSFSTKMEKFKYGIVLLMLAGISLQLSAAFSEHWIKAKESDEKNARRLSRDLFRYCYFDLEGHIDCHSLNSNAN